jgi:hypothetical protein
MRIVSAAALVATVFVTTACGGSKNSPTSPTGTTPTVGSVTVTGYTGEITQLNSTAQQRGGPDVQRHARGRHQHGPMGERRAWRRSAVPVCCGPFRPVMPPAREESPSSICNYLMPASLVVNAKPCVICTMFLGKSNTSPRRG